MLIRGGMASSGPYDSISMVFRAARRMHLPPQMMLDDCGIPLRQECRVGVALTENNSGLRAPPALQQLMSWNNRVNTSRTSYFSYCFQSNLSG